ncbi:MAG: hypothetical protein WC836_13105 [Desulfobacula sp.]
MKKFKLILGLIFAFCILTTCYAADLTLTGDLTSGRHYTNGAISTQGTTVINPGVDVDLAAQTIIKFGPGFKVVQGGKLRAAVSPDTDGDLILDLVEKRSNCEDFQLADTDSDGLSDSAEDINRNGIHEPGTPQNETCACNRDTDSDGMDDGWEKRYGLNALVNDADGDLDGDRLKNHMEYKLSSNPNDPTSLPSKRSYYEYDELGRIKRITRIK